MENERVKPMSSAWRRRMREPIEWKQLQPWKGRTERHQTAFAGRAQHLEHEVAHGHTGGVAARLRGQGLALALASDLGQARAHVIPRARARMDQALGFEQVVGLEHGGGADAARAAGLAHRGQALAGAQRAAVDELGDRVGVAFVAFHVQGRGKAAGRRQRRGEQ